MSAAPTRAALATALALALAPGAPASPTDAGAAAAEASRAGGASSFDAGDLRRAGLVRIGDVLRLAETWDVTTVEGFTLDARPPGVAGGAGAGFAVFVDGIPLDLDLLGSTSLNRLPLSLERVERVTFDDRPIVVRGRLAPGGAVHVTTSRPGAAVSLRARHVSGSETGDPGPNQFTERATPNVERFGFESSALLGVSRSGSPPAADAPPTAEAPCASRFWSDAAFGRARHYAGDEAILPRWVAIGGGDFRVIEKEAPSWRAGWDGAHGEVAVHAGASAIDEGFFLRALGREIPVESTFREIGAHGAWRPRPGGAFTLEASARSTTNELDATERRGAPRLEWRRKARGGDVAAIVGRGGRAASFGARVDSYEVHSRNRTLRARTWVSSGVFARFAADDASGASRTVDLSLGRSRGRAVYAVGFSRVWAGVDASLLAARQGPEESAPFSFWRERGLDVLDEAGVPITTRGDLRGATLLSGDLGVTFGGGPAHLAAMRPGAAGGAHRFSVRLGVFARRFADLSIDDARFVADSLGVPGAADLALHAEEQGTAAGGTLRATRRLAPSAQVRVAWRGQDAVDGTALFRAVSRSTPKHLARAALLAAPVRELEVELAVRARSAARWRAYEPSPESLDAGASLDGANADASLPAAAAVDLSFSKSFARRRLHLGLAFRNLFDRPVRTHPIGEIERLTVVVQAELALGGE